MIYLKYSVYKLFQLNLVISVKIYYIHHFIYNKIFLYFPIQKTNYYLSVMIYTNLCIKGILFKLNIKKYTG